MAIFTMVMGNAFAASRYGRRDRRAVADPWLWGDPRWSRDRHAGGFCGTLMTPMAANFNLVPAALLELGINMA
jgi:uncharacterized membrane protein